MSLEIPLPSSASCLFLDVDGTLIEFSSIPSRTSADTDLRNLLGSSSKLLDGALALISGRSIQALDAIFHPMRLPAAGSHGGELRLNPDRDPEEVSRDERLDFARRSLSRTIAAYPGVILEDKKTALGVHFRMNAAARAPLYEEVDRLVGLLGPPFHRLNGDMVVEIKPISFDKADAMRRFMALPPFHARSPVFVGDDQTDVTGFEYVERLGGNSIAVGDKVRARWRFENPAAVREWLRKFIASGAN
jgi:trehalose 6-phosphate phosphatase